MLHLNLSAITLEDLLKDLVIHSPYLVIVLRFLAQSEVGYNYHTLQESFVLGDMFKTENDQIVKFIYGICTKNVTSEGLPGWLWTTEEDLRKADIQLFDSKIPDCGK